MAYMMIPDQTNPRLTLRTTIGSYTQAIHEILFEMQRELDWKTDEQLRDIEAALEDTYVRLLTLRSSSRTET